MAGLVGHSFGGAVVIRTAASSTMVGTVIALAGQCSGGEQACQLGPRCSLFFRPRDWRAAPEHIMHMSGSLTAGYDDFELTRREMGAAATRADRQPR